MIPNVWLIIIAVSGVGGPTIKEIPFVSTEACVAAAQGIRDQKPRWADENTIVVCSETGSRR